MLGLLIPHGMLPIACPAAGTQTLWLKTTTEDSDFPGVNPLACTRFPTQIPLQQHSSALAVLLSLGMLLVLLLLTRSAGKFFKELKILCAYGKGHFWH